VVEQHGGYCYRFYDDHAGSGRESSQKGQHGNTGVAGGERDTDDEKVGTGAAAGRENPPQSYRHDKNIDQKQVDRKHPHGFGDVTFIGVFNHHDVKLSRQQHDGAHGQKQHGKGGNRLRISVGRIEREQLCEAVGIGGLKAGEYIAEAVEKPIGDENSHTQQADEFYQ